MGPRVAHLATKARGINHAMVIQVIPRALQHHVCVCVCGQPNYKPRTSFPKPGNSVVSTSHFF